MSTSAVAAPADTAVAGVEWQVAPEARHNESQRGQQRPPSTAAGRRRITAGTRLIVLVPVISRPTTIAVVDDGTSTAEAGHPVDRSPCGVRRVHARPRPVVLPGEHLVTVHTPRPHAGGRHQRTLARQCGTPTKQVPRDAARARLPHRQQDGRRRRGRAVDRVARMTAALHRRRRLSGGGGTSRWRRRTVNHRVRVLVLGSARLGQLHIRVVNHLDVVDHVATAADADRCRRQLERVVSMIKSNFVTVLIIGRRPNR